MNEKKKKTILYLLVVLALVILISVGSTFAYFTATVNSSENAITTTAAEFKLLLEEDVELIKSNIIPSEERYVDMAIARRNEDGSLKKPYQDSDTGKTITEGTTCIDDNLNEICSVYTFTIINPITTNDIPLYITLNPSVNNFENLYYKVINSEGDVVISARRLIDDRYQIGEDGAFLKNENGELIPKDNFETLTISPVVLTGINNTLPKAIDEDTPSKVTYSIVMWIMETHTPQNESDSGKSFSATLKVSSGEDGKGITGKLSASGTE